jgi:hypothetical protein
MVRKNVVEFNFEARIAGDDTRGLEAQAVDDLRDLRNLPAFSA